MGGFMEKYKLKLGNQIFILKKYIFLSYIETYDLYAVSYSGYDKPLFFISPYFASIILTNNLAYWDGLIRSGALATFLEDHKTILKDFYYDLAYRNTKKLDNKIYEKIVNKRSILKKGNTYNVINIS